MVEFKWHKAIRGGLIKLLSGPLFGPETDLLDIAEEILDLNPGHPLNVSDGSANALADRLVMIDIARSLRLIADAPGVQSVHQRYGTTHRRTIQLPVRGWR